MAPSLVVVCFCVATTVCSQLLAAKYSFGSQLSEQSMPDGDQQHESCMSRWLAVYDSSLSAVDLADFEQGLLDFSTPVDEQNLRIPRLLARAFGGTDRAQEFSDCIGRTNSECKRRAPCGEHGKCLARPVVGSGLKLYRCHCSAGRRGRYCQKEANSCASRPCGNGGSCEDLRNGSHICHCPVLHEGRHCETAWLSRGQFQDVTHSLKRLAADVMAFRQEANMAAEQWPKVLAFMGEMEKRLVERLDEPLRRISANLSNLEKVVEKLKAAQNNPSAGGGFYKPPTACLRHGNSSSRIVDYRFGNRTTRAFCNMSIDGGGWIVIARFTGSFRLFDRTWAQYKTGFGLLQGPHWLGNDNIHHLTSQGPMELRVDFISPSNTRQFFTYNGIRVASEAEKYRLDVGQVTGSSFTITGGSGLDYQAGPFSTRDRDNDRRVGSCAALSYHGGIGWWWNNCANIAPIFITGQGYLSSFFEMKIRPAEGHV